jgi:SMODS-associating 2TM, beta-strand rich effector domain
MISLLPMAQVVGFIAVVYAVLITLTGAITWKFGGHSETLWGSVGFAFSGATALQIVLMGWFYFGWRHLWRWFPALSRLLFPDIGGEWKIKINWQGDGRRGVVDAEATVRQDFLRVSMEVRSPKSESQTLIAQPKKDPESGRPLLYYVYLVTPKAVGANPSLPYHGAAILKFSEAGGGELSGNYWTTQQTAGHFRLSRRT